MVGSQDDGEASTLGASSGAETIVDGEAGSQLTEGATLGRYVLVSRLGAGAMGVVWSAIDPKLQRNVAIKVVHPALARAPEAASRLLREARAMAKVSHRAVVTIHDAGDVDGSLFLAMELVPGTTLGAMLRARTPAEAADWRRWLAMMLDAGRGLAAAHRAGVLHRDFKPDNVLVDLDGRVCVGDFGLASLGDVARERSSKTNLDAIGDGDLTTTGTLLGTPLYMSPQQLRSEPVDARADQYSFCVACYEAVFGVRPFETTARGLEVLDVLSRSIEAGLGPQPRAPAVPTEVFDVLRRGLSPDPAKRWPDVETLLAALVSATDRFDATIPNPKVSRSRRVAWIAAGIAALAVAGVGALVVSRPGTAPAVPVRMFAVPLSARIAVSHDGRRIAIGGGQLEVRELDGQRAWSHPLRSVSESPTHLEFTEADDALRFGIRFQFVGRWAYAVDGPVVIESTSNKREWVAHVREGDLFVDSGPPISLVLVKPDDSRRSWPLPEVFEVFATSPGGTRFAYVEAGGSASRFGGTIVVVDLATGQQRRSGPLTEPTALAWSDDETLLYATGTSERPTIYRARLAADRLGEPSIVYQRPKGWFSILASGPHRLYFVDAQPSTRARLIERGAGATSIKEFSPASISAGLGWTADGDFLSWNATTNVIDRHAQSGQGRGTSSLKLLGEPVNATIAGDLLIVAVRRTGSREILALSLIDGRVLWHHTGDGVLAVRCAGDRAAPCFAIRTTNARSDQLVSLDPGTGTLGSTVITEGVIDDVAVRADGQRLLVSNRSIVRELGLDGAELQRWSYDDLKMSTARSVAYDPKGGILVAGTAYWNTYQVERWADGTLTLLAQSDTDILSLVRPSSDGDRTLVLGRAFACELFSLPLP